MVRRGAVLTYNVDATRCDANLPDIPTYSFGDVLNDAYIEFSSEQEWRMYTATERPVNSSRFHVQNGAWRVTELEFTPSGPDDGTAFFTITDIEQGADGKRMGGAEIEHESEVFQAFRAGMEMTFVVDLSTCAKQGERFTRPGRSELVTVGAGNEYWAGRINGYRIPQNNPGMNSEQFTSLLMGPKQREVFEVRVQGQDQVVVKAYSLSRPTHQPTPVITYMCHLGMRGGFHIFRL
ncbi:hypothetical protein BaRGS_00031015 [Batillaria attramentaria]|uniref:Uncharacterized protein n=1 Tax=Batillaria attramentaria TaxID=370345 RepID=A0ABD0JRV4_9CAEN